LIKLRQSFPVGASVVVVSGADAGRKATVAAVGRHGRTDAQLAQLGGVVDIRLPVPIAAGVKNVKPQFVVKSVQSAILAREGTPGAKAAEAKAKAAEAKAAAAEPAPNAQQQADQQQQKEALERLNAAALADLHQRFPVNTAVIVTGDGLDAGRAATVSSTTNLLFPLVASKDPDERVRPGCVCG